MRRKTNGGVAEETLSGLPVGEANRVPGGEADTKEHVCQCRLLHTSTRIIGTDRLSVSGPPCRRAAFIAVLQTVHDVMICIASRRSQRRTEMMNEY